MAEKKIMTEKEMGKKIVDLKIELLKNPTKKKSIKKEIARMLTVRNVSMKDKIKSSEDKK